MSVPVDGLSRRRAIIVGAGHSGLAVAGALIAGGLQPQVDFVVIDAARPNERSWARRWHSLQLESTARESALPAMPFPGDQHAHPRGDEMAAYLQHVTDTLGVVPRWGTAATQVHRLSDGPTLELVTSAGAAQTRNVVAATGGYAVPRRPDWVYSLSVPGICLHSDEYLYPRQIPPGRVLVVGGGRAAVEVASELSASHEVTLSTRNPSIGRNLQQHRRWIEKAAGADAAKPGSITVIPEIVAADGGTVLLRGGTGLAPESVVFATGYHPGDSWLPPTVGPRRGRRGRDTGMPGLFVVGIPGYGHAQAAQIRSAGIQARWVARRILERP